MTDEGEDVLARIRALLVSGLDARAADNAARDLAAIEQRLRTGAYQEADFVERSVFEVGRRTREFVAYMQGWNAQALRWASLLGRLSMPNDVVIDLCPGWAPKIELALARCRFAGRVVVVDRSPESLSMLADFLAVLVPPFTLDAVVEDVMAPPGERRPRARLVVANHVVDDLLLDRWVRARGGTIGALYDDERALADAWRGVLRDGPTMLDAFAPDAAAAIGSYVDGGGTLVLSHYSSLIERLLGGPDVAAFFARAFTDVRGALVQAGFVAQALPPDAPGFTDDTAAIFTRA